MHTEFAIVDLFAGPGGLAEGFASIRGDDGTRPFRIALSIEKEPSAFQTLRLRSFLRQFSEGAWPEEYYRFVQGEIEQPDWRVRFESEWTRACHETAQLELGSKRSAPEIEARLARIKRDHGDNIILIGGPPCQAYSLVGRARNKGTEGYEARRDKRHFLYREYIRILERLMPAAFVMENVKGLLSSSVDGVKIFDKVLDDLSGVGGGAYRLISLDPRSGQQKDLLSGRPPASDFVVRAEDHGVPQARHRVIILGIRNDVAARLTADEIEELCLKRTTKAVRVQDVLSGMPKLRSGLTSCEDSEKSWRTQAARVMRSVSGVAVELPRDQLRTFRRLGKRTYKALIKATRINRRSGGNYSSGPATCPADLRAWLVDGNLLSFPNHETRSHMVSDLGRYFFAALYGQATGNSPKASDFPRELAPDHRNWRSGKFADRFRVQLWKSPATTVTSHIAKDGHYFIHPDPSQCRSLTVREAARLQTFPDNYCFLGNRTQQYTQVGNAVPPLLARAIAKNLHTALLAASAGQVGRKLKKTG